VLSSLVFTRVDRPPPAHRLQYVNLGRPVVAGSLSRCQWKHRITAPFLKVFVWTRDLQPRLSDAVRCRKNLTPFKTINSRNVNNTTQKNYNGPNGCLFLTGSVRLGTKECARASCLAYPLQRLSHGGAHGKHYGKITAGYRETIWDMRSPWLCEQTRLHRMRMMRQSSHRIHPVLRTPLVTK
jgi:hypothetical protein